MLVVIDHPALEQPIFVASNTEDVVSVGEVRGVAGQTRTFIGIPLEIDLPTQDGDTPGRAAIKVDNLDPIVVNTLRTVNAARAPGDASPEAPYISVRFEVILADNPDQPELVFDGLRIVDATYDATTVTGKLAYETVATEPVAETITPNRFPGLF